MTGARTLPRRVGRPRRDLRRRDHALRGLVAVVAAALVLGLVWLRASGSYDGPQHVSAQLTDAGGSLGPGADVKVRGVIVGTVDDISRGPTGGVRVRIALRDHRLGQVPANVVARILPATLFGTSYVDLVTAGAPSSQPLRAGAVIPADRTQGTLELQQALDDVDRLVKAVGPADLASAIGSMAQALDGRGAQIGTTLGRASAYLGRLNPKLPQVRADLAKLAANLELLAQVAPDLLAATADALVTARTVVDQQRAIATLLGGGTKLTARATAFLRAHRVELVRFIDNAATLLGVVHDNRQAGITGAIQTNTMLGEKVRTVLHHGFLDAVTTFLLDVPPYYTAADCPRAGAARGDNCPRGATGRVAGGRR